MSSIGNKDIMSKNLKRYIDQSGKDRRALAETWGFPYSTVTDWINGKKYPRIDRIEIMADYFGIKKSDLIEEHEPDEQKKPVQMDGLTENQRILLEFARQVPDDKAEMILRVVKSILGDEQ